MKNTIVTKAKKPYLYMKNKQKSFLYEIQKILNISKYPFSS